MRTSRLTHLICPTGRGIVEFGHESLCRLHEACSPATPKTFLRHYRGRSSRRRSRYGVVAPLHREIASASRTMPTLHSERDAFYLAAPARPSRRLSGKGVPACGTQQLLAVGGASSTRRYAAALNMHPTGWWWDKRRVVAVRSYTRRSTCGVGCGSESCPRNQRLRVGACRAGRQAGA